MACFRLCGAYYQAWRMEISYIMHLPHRRLLKLLGSLYGSGKLTNANGGHSYGTVAYEIDGYFDQVAYSGNGRIEGGANMLRHAFREGPARIVLADGQVVEVALDDPQGDAVAEITVRGRLPEFDD
jgi:hypothetical protein